VREGWLLSDGEVIASAIADDALLSCVLPQRLLSGASLAAVVPARHLLLARSCEPPIDVISIGSEDLIVDVRPLRAWRAMRPPRGSTTLALLLAADAERAQLAPGRRLEFREGR
jgi:hypothetical protein